MNAGQAEPERALEFLKQLEDFTRKIEKANRVQAGKKRKEQLSNTKDEGEQAKEDEFLDGRISKLDRDAVSRTSDQLQSPIDDFLRGDNRIEHTIYLQDKKGAPETKARKVTYT